MLTFLRFHGMPVTKMSIRMIVWPTSCLKCGRSKFSTSQCNKERSSAFVAVSSNLTNYTYPNYLPKCNYSKKRAKESVPEEPLTEEETEQVLKVVNEVQQAEDLLKYIIPKRKAEDIIQRKIDFENNRISTLAQLISIVGPKVKIYADKFYVLRTFMF